DAEQHGARITRLLAVRLPDTFLGYSTNFEPVGPDSMRRLRMTTGALHHGVVVAGLEDWLTGHLGFTPLTGITVFDWLATPTQTLAEVTQGAVFHDGLG